MIVYLHIDAPHAKKNLALVYVDNKGADLGLEVIKLEFILRLKIKLNDWLIADTCPQAANHYVLF